MITYSFNLHHGSNYIILINKIDWKLKCFIKCSLSFTTESANSNVKKSSIALAHTRDGIKTWKSISKKPQKGWKVKGQKKSLKKVFGCYEMTCCRLFLFQSRLALDFGPILCNGFYTHKHALIKVCCQFFIILDSLKEKIIPLVKCSIIKFIKIIGHWFVEPQRPERARN